MTSKSRLTKAELLARLEAVEAEQAETMAMFSTRIPVALKARVKEQSLKTKGGTQALVTEALSDYLNKHAD